MTSINSKKSKLNIYIKQYLNAFNDIDLLINKLSNDTSENYKCISMYNYLNIPDMFRDIDNNSPIPFTWEGNKNREKGIQTAKEEFISQRGNFGEAMVNKIYKKRY